MTPIEKIIERVVQRYVTQLQDLYNDVPDLFDWAFLAAMSVFLAALLPHLDPAARDLYDEVIGKSETMILPRSADPRNEVENI